MGRHDDSSPDSRSPSRDRTRASRHRSSDRHGSRRSVSPRPSRRRHHHHDDSEADSDREYRRRHRHRSDRKRRRSVSSDSSAYSSSSDEDDRRRRHKKSKKSKKSKKKSKKKKKSKHSVGDKWGKYGIIHESDIFTKEAEFEAWLLEVKKADILTLPNSKRKEMFIDFMDDYNTATMPHEKYYNLSRWEARQQAIRMGEAPPPIAEGTVNLKKDEEQLRLQHRQAARAAASRQPALSLSKDQLDELTKVNRERVQADRLRKMGLTPKEGMGVRYEYEPL
ncbi:hypothetical protein E5Q_01632 [Lichtheimia corymbifera JMRC:FSU:9682]|uniref:Uncharacterized protein n=1 Tax=Lichtheimia corymbifera JMRC:FSU:9682 TaxID=1263082 RepID=A0A068SG41_9FUNG|nr:hypothetical protein E5Q_01632 [Lichtheimia corymbifera JMRC:FSU:9682]